jgi:hypothetical protein
MLRQCPERPQMIRAFVVRMDEGAHRNAACAQQFAYVPTALALSAAGCSSNENQSICHIYAPLPRYSNRVLLGTARRTLGTE